MSQHENQEAVKRNRVEDILQAACRVIRKQGLHKARIADIASEAGTSYGLIYHYFKSKDELFDAILKVWWDGFYARLDELDRLEAPVEEKLRGVAEYFLDQYEQRPDLVHIFIAEISRSTHNLTPARMLTFKQMMARTESYIASAQKSHTVRNDIKARYLNYFFLGALEGFISTMVYENQSLKGRGQKNRIVGSLLELFFEGARADE